MIKNILNIMLIVTIVIAAINLLLYTPRLWCWIKGFKKQKHIINDKQNKLAIIIPARNESKVIGELFDSIKTQTYPQELVDVYVIVKDANDKTIELTKEFGGTCYVHETQTCKGEALDLAFKHILKERPYEYEGLIVVDADCILESHFLEEMNNSIASNRQVFQAKKLVKNYLCDNKKANSLASSCNGLIWTLIDDMGNLHKSNINVTNMTIGTGIMLKMDLVRRLGGWPYCETVTEDIEFMKDCAIKGVETYYNTYCKMYVEESTSLSVTNKRRSRWLKGVIDSGRIYHEELSNLTGIKNMKNRYYVEALNYAIRYIGALAIFGSVTLIGSIILHFFGREEWLYSLILSLSSIGLIYISFFIMTIFCLLIDGKNIKLPFYKKIILLFVHPLFYMEYIPIISRALLTGRSKKWDVIERIDFEMSGEKNDN